MKGKRWLSLALALILAFSLCTGAFAVESAEDPPENAPERHQPGDQVHAIIVMDGEPTAPRTPGAPLLTARSEASLLSEHTAVKQRMDKKSIAYTVDFEYTALLNGMAVMMDWADVKTVAALPGVADVVIAEQYSLPDTEPASVYASDMIDADWLSSELAADGSGKVIAVIDSGVKLDHEAFGVYSGMLQTPAWTKTEMLKAIRTLGRGAYYSQKIPFQYDYADKDQDAMDDYVGHGSHVAGIAAGYVATDEGEITFRGSAPDAQILAMKIFRTGSSLTDSAFFLAALDDAYKLGADVINMSIGRPSGFVEDGTSVLYDRIFERLEAAGILCCVAAGNDGSTAENALTRAGNNYLTTGNADYGMLSTPASYNGNLAVASAMSAGVGEYFLLVGEHPCRYLAGKGSPFLETLGGQDLPYVMVPGSGAPEDYEGLDVAGKAAVIRRGGITFVDKIAAAENAGAAAVLIYHNQEGELVTMTVREGSIPAAFVSQVTGVLLRDQAEKVLHVNAEKTVDMRPETWRLAATSSWGPTNDLQIKPAVTGVGGNINSVDYKTTDGYKTMSGTSMATPNVAGGFASLIDAIGAANPGMTKTEIAAMARNRVLSSARPISAGDTLDESGSITSVLYSPRRQGAGVMDLRAAFNTVLVIDEPLAELGDDPARSGVYTVASTVRNTGDTERTYAVRADVLTDAVTSKNIGTESAPNVHWYNSVQSKALRPGADYTLTAPETITLAPGETRTVSVTVSLTESFLSGYLDTYFENGAFIDGFVTFESLDGGDALPERQHITFLAFCGDWTAAPIVDAHDWRDLMGLDDQQIKTWRPYVDWEIDTIPTKAQLMDENEVLKHYAGDNPMGWPGGVRDFSEARIALSNNADQALYTRMQIALVNIRNARHLILIVRDAETGKIYSVDHREFCRKVAYNDLLGWRTDSKFPFDAMDTYSGGQSAAIPNNTKLTLEFYANLPYGEDALGGLTPEQIVTDGARYLAYSFPCVVDSEAPVIEDWDYDYQAGTVTVTARDNQFLAGIAAADADGAALGETQIFADAEPGQSHTVTLQVGQQSSFTITAMDYATNESSEKAAPQLVICRQPEDAFVRRGDTAVFTVEASGSGLTYQWQHKSANSSLWTNSLLSGARSSTISVQAGVLTNGSQYRCVIKDANGQRVTSDAATLTIVTAPKITVQPENVTVTAGSEAQFRVVAEGGGLSCQWQYSADNGATWNNSKSATGKTDTLTFKTTAAYNGRLYRCVVTNAAGTAVSNTAKLLVTTSGPVIVTQPQDTAAVPGGSAKFTVKAKGTGLTYQWQYSADNGATWRNSTAANNAKATMYVTAKLSFDGRLYRCVVTDSSGRTVVSGAAKLTVKSDGPVITVQPKPASAAAGGSARFSVTAVGSGLTYQWQYSKDNGATWTNSTASGTANATIYITVKASFHNRLYRCVVTDANGKTAVSEAVRLTVQ